MKKYFLGLAANYTREDRRAQLFSFGRKEDCRDLETFLNRKYDGMKTILTKNGRSALALALKANFDKGDGIIVNGFTCYAVFEAIKAAGLVPIFADIESTNLNYSLDSIKKALVSFKAPGAHPNSSPRGIIIQNTLGNPVNIHEIEEYAKEHKLIIIEDLAHSAGVKYTDGREAGRVGNATVLSFGKEKSIDTISGGAVIFRSSYKNIIEAPKKHPKLSDHLKARLYPTFGHICQALTYVGIGGGLMRLLVKIRLVERSADNKLDLERKISKFEAKRALLQIKSLNRNGEKPLRQFYLVKDQKEVLKKLQNAGYYFGGFWYEKPVSPERYYKKVHFPEEECPNAVYISKHIINFPNYYTKKQLKPAIKIVEEYLEEVK